MTAKEIAEILSANGVDMERGFADIDSLSFASPECHELSDEIVEYISTLTEHGVNNGFNRSMENVIDDLTKVCMQLTTRNAKAVKNLPKYRDTFVEDKGYVTLSTKGPDLSIKENVIKHIDMEIEALDYLKKRVEVNEHLSESAKAIRLTEKEKEIEKLKEIKSAVENTIDNCSIDAAALADSILDDVIDAAEIISANQDNDKVFEYYASALEKAKKWSARRKAVGKREIAKPEAVPKFNADADRLAIVTMSMDIERNALRFRDNLESFKRASEKYDNYERYEAQIKENQAEIDKLRKGIGDSVFAVKSGTMSKTEFARLTQRAEREIERRQHKIDELDARIDERFDAGMINEDMLAKMERIDEELARYEDNRVMLYFIGKGVNFVTLTKLMNGEPISEDEWKNVVTMQTRLTTVPQEMQVNLQSAFDRINNIDNIVRASHTDKKRVTQSAQTTAEREKREAEENAYFEKMAAMYGTAATPQESEETPLREDMDDILHTER